MIKREEEILNAAEEYATGSPQATCRGYTDDEACEDVIKLVSPFYQDERVTIIHEDIFNYKPKEIFDYGWFDIWTYICSDNYNEMKRLNRKFARSVKDKGHWCYYECKQAYKNDKN